MVSLRIGLVCVFGLTFFLSAIQDANATIQYSVSPLVITETVVPRDILERTVTVTNTGDTPITVYPTVNNIALGEGGTIEEFVPQVMSDQTRSLAAWLEIKRIGQDIRAGESHTFTVTIRVNPNALPGEYHAYLGFPIGGNRDEAERTFQSGMPQGVVISAKIHEKKNTLLKLAQFVVDRFVLTSNNDAASFTVRNPGDEPLTPLGEIIFYNAKGVEVGAIPVNAEHVEVAPGTEHVFRGDVPTEGLFGKYKAFLSVEYGSANLASVQDTTFFYALPLTTVLTVLGIVIAVVIALSVYVHKRYLDDDGDDGSEQLSLHVKNTRSDPLHHDIDLRPT